MTENPSNANTPIIVWFRDDLRVSDNPALDFAATSGRPIVPLFVLDEVSPGARPVGSAQKWMLNGALHALVDQLRSLGADLVIRRGSAICVLEELAAEVKAGSVVWNRRIGAAATQTDKPIATKMRAAGLDVLALNGNLLHDPSSLLTIDGGPYRVYSPFWRAFERDCLPRSPIKAPASLTPLKCWPRSEPLDALELLPHAPNWAGGLADTWIAGEAAAKQRLEKFLQSGLAGYSSGRDFPARENVSRLSPYLRWGMISPYQIWESLDNSPTNEIDRLKFKKELVWREFSYHLLHHFPDIAEHNFNKRFDAFPWREQAEETIAWQKGETGYPLVDAGMRELWQTGYMHNRVRMVTASFLVKHLLIDWRVGERWFWDTLVDGDPANNPASWQWVAGSGADAAPYFRIFNPILQSRKFDSSGAYIRKWIPELAKLDNRTIHAPWEAPASVLADAGVRLGENYPRPLTPHDQARKRALEAFNALKKED